ncbi:MAG TPA: ABC transporter substrate-binding protein [Hyphomicrobiaceae bacterium]|nr:ABC transporter substrate-binding protein [Hyphomicrobiaceae bacterium]
MKRLLSGLTFAAMTISSTAAFAACGNVSIGEMNWNSARVIANIEKFVLQVGYGCKVEMIQTTTVPGVTSQAEKGTPDILSETWINSVAAVFKKGVEEGRIVEAGEVLSDGGVEAWWIPKYLADKHPELKTVADIKKNWKLFADPENPGKGRFHTCPAGWACQIINANMFKAYGMGDTFINFDPGSGDGLKGSIAKAAEQKQPWVGYYWAPTAILGRYPMVKIGLNAHDAKGHACNQKKDCATPHAGSFPPGRVLSTTTKAFKEKNPEAFKFISKISISNAVMNETLAWGEKNQGKGAEMAGYFMQKHAAAWKTWMPADVAKKVEAALK